MDRSCGRIIRLLVLGVRAQRPRRYYLSFQALAPGVPAAVSFPSANASATDNPDGGAAAGLQAGMVCRTETASFGKTPEFINRAFVLRLPCQLDPASSSSSTGPGLAVNLFSTPSDEDPVGPVVAGKEMDILVASGILNLAGPDVGNRLALGERVMVPLQLIEAESKQQPQLPGGLGGQAAQLQSMRNSAAAGSNLYSSSDTQVLLELLLVDAAVPMLSSSTAPSVAAVASRSLQKGADTHAGQGDSLTTGRSAEPAGIMLESAPGPEVVLSVFVSAALNLPMVPGPDSKQLVPPCAFVTLRSAADVAAKRPAQAMTRVAPPALNPVWGQLLQLRYPEQELPHEQLHVAVVHEGSAGQHRVLVKGALKLATLIPGQHYSFAMALSEACTLYITAVLSLGSRTLVDALLGCGMTSSSNAASTGVLQLRLTATNQPLNSLLASVQQQSSSGRSSGSGSSLAGGEIWAVWRSSPKLQSRPTQQQQQQQQLYTPLDGREGKERVASFALRSMNSGSGLLAAAVGSRGSAASDSDDGASGGVVVALPVQSAASGDMLWPASHQILLPCWTSNPTTAVLELYVQSYTHSANSSNGSKGTSNSNSSSSSIGLQAATCFARLELPFSAITAQQSGKIFTIQDLQLSAISAAGKAAGKAGALVSTVNCAFEVAYWGMAAFMHHLQQLVEDATKAAAAAAAAQQAAAAAAADASGMELASLLQTDQDGLLQQTSHSIRLASNDVLETLVGDALAKQNALERFQRSLEAAKNKQKLATSRITNLQSENSRLTADLQHLRQLLHEEKEAQVAALSNNSSAKNPALVNASREELFKQLDIVAAARAKERARNGELVHRLQQLHAEQVDMLELQKHYAELQEAHYQQSQLLSDQETAAATIATLKKAVADQESVIHKLEGLLAAAAARSKDNETWRSTAKALQLEVARLRDEIARLAAARPADEIAAAAARAAAAAAEQHAAAAALAEKETSVAVAVAEYEARLSAKESDRLAAAMRAEKAEAAATAAQNELLDVTKRYAREIAQLKTKLAEKDAQLLGGFGSLANLYLSELPGGQNPTTLNPQAMSFTTLNPQMMPPGLGLPNPEGLGFTGLPGLNPSWGMQPGSGFNVGGIDLGLVGRSMSPAAAGAGLGPTAAAAAGSRHSSAGRGGSPKLQPLPAAAAVKRQGSPQQQQQQGGAAAAAAAAQAQAVGRASSYQMRAGSAEAVAGSSSKPGSPLAPIAAGRLSNSAESNRFSRAGMPNASTQQQQQQRMGVETQEGSCNGSQQVSAIGTASGSGRFTAAAASAAGAGASVNSSGAGSVAASEQTRQLSLQWQQQQQSSGGVQARMTSEQQQDFEEGDEYEDEYENEWNGDYTEDGVQRMPTDLQLQQVQQQQISGRQQLLHVASQRLQQQQPSGGRQQQQQSSPGGQATPLGNAQQQQPPKSGFRKWFG